jgi:hypothetical protein
MDLRGALKAVRASAWGGVAGGQQLDRAVHLYRHTDSQAAGRQPCSSPLLYVVGMRLAEAPIDLEYLTYLIIGTDIFHTVYLRRGDRRADCLTGQGTVRRDEEHLPLEGLSDTLSLWKAFGRAGSLSHSYSRLSYLRLHSLHIRAGATGTTHFKRRGKGSCFQSWLYTWALQPSTTCYPPSTC